MCLRDCTQAAPTSPRSRSSLSPTTPDLNDPVNIEALFQENLRGEHKAYHDLIQDGGRPSHRPDDAGFGIFDEPGEYADIISYWTNGWPDSRCIISDQWWHWQKFREYQDRMRKRYANLKHFEKLVQFVREYRKEKGLEGDICLLPNRKDQSRLDDWKEFQFHEYRTADRFIADIERAAKELKTSEEELQAAIAAGRPADRINRIQEQGVGYDKAQRRTAERKLKRHAVFLKWIDEQLPIIASECQLSGIRSESRDEHQSDSVSTHLGKRKRSTEDATDRTAGHRKLSKSCHVTNGRAKVEVDNTPDSAASLPINTDSRDLELVDLPQHSVRGSQPQRSKRIATSRREATVPNLAATSVLPRGSYAVKDGQPIEKCVAALLDNDPLKVSKPSRKRPSPKPANSSGGRKHAKQAPVQTRDERLQVQAGSNVGTRVAAHDAERALLRPAHASRVSKARAGEIKARGGKVVQVSPRNTQVRDGQPPSGLDERRGEDAKSRGRKSAVPRSRQKLSPAGEPVRRSQRISQRPVHYPK